MPATLRLLARRRGPRARRGPAAVHALALALASGCGRERPSFVASMHVTTLPAGGHGVAMRFHAPERTGSKRTEPVRVEVMCPLGKRVVVDEELGYDTVTERIAFAKAPLPAAPARCEVAVSTPRGDWADRRPPRERDCLTGDVLERGPCEPAIVAPPTPAPMLSEVRVEGATADGVTVAWNATAGARAESHIDVRASLRCGDGRWRMASAPAGFVTLDPGTSLPMRVTIPADGDRCELQLLWIAAGVDGVYCLDVPTRTVTAGSC
jgi:hypothetical protein